MRLAIIVRALAPYRNRLYDEIALKLGGSSEVTVFTGDGGTQDHYPWSADALNMRGVRVQYVPSLRGKRGWLAKDWPNPLLWKRLSEFNPTHVWMHEFSPYVLLGYAWARTHGRLCFVSTEIGDRFPGKFTPSNKGFHRFVKRRCDGVIAFTQSAYETARKTNRRALFVPHAIDTTVFVPGPRKPSGEPTGKVRVLQTGILNERKGVDLLLKAFRRCVDAGPADLELVLLGGGDHSWTQELIHSLKLTDHARIAPFAQGADLIAEYQQADIFVLASREDTYAVVVHEAAACGLPLVISRYAGASETLVVEGQSGFVVDPYETESFGNAIGRLAADADLRKTFGEHARRRAELFSVQESAQKVVAWLREQSWSLPVKAPYSFPASNGKVPGAALPAAELPERTILWVDPNLTYDSPTMRHLLHSLPHLRAAGWTVRAWCVQSDAPRDQVEHVFFPMPGKLRQVEGILFFFRVNFYGLFLRLRGKPRPATIIQATLGTYLGADVVAVHFLSALWARRVISLGLSGWKEYAGYALTLWNAWWERVHLSSPAVRLALPVSDSIGAAAREWTAAGLRIETLPNSFDETRFKVEVRARWRETQRAALGFAPADQVFIFVSMGHYKRKGFWLAVDALQRLRMDAATELPNKSIRLLVVGGTPGTLAAVASRLDDQYAGWRKWITLAGMQKEVEKFYAAADSFLFPSYFEAFCLAEIEAAASGLPLLLTPHHGSEMILEDGKNGVKLAFDPAEMSRQIADFLKNGLDGFRPGDAGRGLTREAYARELIRMYDFMLPPDTGTVATGESS